MDRKELIAIRLNLLRRNFHPDHTPTLVAVSKKMPFEDIAFAYKAGVVDFGENRVEELVKKSQMAVEQGLNIRWHYIGNIQSKKVNKLFKCPNLHAIHSVDSFQTLQTLVEKSDILRHPVQIFLQVNTSNEKEKAGFIEWDDIAAAINLFLKNEDTLALKLFGLMTMSKFRTDNFEEDALKCFEHLVKVRDSLVKDFDLNELKLSMGMSSDFEQALQAGTDYLRIGSTIFAPDSNR